MIMKNILIGILLFLCQNVLAESQDKIYSFKKNKSEIKIEKPLIRTEEITGAGKHLLSFWSIGLIRSNLNYDLPTYTAAPISFSPASVGFSFGRTSQNNLLNHLGYYEVSLEWQAFKRESAITQGYIFSQKLDLYQLNIFQNFYLGSFLKQSVLFSIGAGIAPVFLTSEQSVFANSTADLGYEGMLKGNIIVPFKKDYELDFGARIGGGRIGDRKIDHSALILSFNFKD